MVSAKINRIMHYVIYKTTNILNNKIYVGKHTTKNLDDGYLGSGYVLLKALKKYGKESFIKEIIIHCKSLEELNITEAKLVDKDFVKRKDTYNTALGGGGGCIAIYKENPKYKEICEKISKANKGNRGWNKGLTKDTSESVRIGHSKTTETRKNNGSYVSKRKGIPLSEKTKQLLRESHLGKTASEETKRKMSETRKKIVSNPDYINPMTGKVGVWKDKKLSEETKQKMSNAMKNRMSNPNYVNPTKGKIRSDEVKNATKIAQSKGTYITPWGRFISSSDAVKHPESLLKDSGTLIKRCRNRIEGYDFIPKSS